MTTLIVVSIGASLLWASRWFQHSSEDLGYVSAQWLAEYRQNHES